MGLPSLAEILGKMQDDSHPINSLVLKNCICHRKVFQNGVNTFSKMVNYFLLNSSKFYIFRIISFVQITPACGPNTYQIMYEDFKLQMSESVIAA